MQTFCQTKNTLRNVQFPTEMTDSQEHNYQFCLKLINYDKLRIPDERENSNDNYLYYPTINDVKDGKTTEHFKKHLRRGEPVIVRDVLDNTKA